jgi:hypothetical protein
MAVIFYHVAKCTDYEVVEVGPAHARGEVALVVPCVLSVAIWRCITAHHARDKPRLVGESQPKFKYGSRLRIGRRRWRQSFVRVSPSDPLTHI